MYVDICEPFKLLNGRIRRHLRRVCSEGDEYADVNHAAKSRHTRVAVGHFETFRTIAESYPPRN